MNSDLFFDANPNQEILQVLKSFPAFPTKNILLYGNDMQERNKILDWLKTNLNASTITDLNFLKNINQEDKLIIINDIDTQLPNLDNKILLNFFEFLDNPNTNIILTLSTLPKSIKTDNQDILSRLNSYLLLKY